jgi:hypothetical protein
MAAANLFINLSKTVIAKGNRKFEVILREKGRFWLVFSV